MGVVFKGNNEVELISRLIDGDIRAFEAVYRGYFSKVLGFVHRFSLSKEETEEVVQDVFFKLWEKRTSIDIDKNFDVFLYVIARNLVVDRMRKIVASEKRLHQVAISSPNSMSHNATEQLVNFYELKDIIDKLIDNLPSRRRMIFKLNREKGMSYKEIADLLKISQGTVEKQMSQAISSLKADLYVKYQIRVNLAILLFICFFQ